MCVLARESPQFLTIFGQMFGGVAVLICRNISGHTKMGRPAARLETMVFEDKLVCSGIVVCKRR